MNRPCISKWMACIALPLVSLPRLLAQAAPATDQPTANSGEKDETVLLSPFVINSVEDEGYDAKYTLAGTRLRTDIKDVGSSVTIVTEKFLADTGTTNATQLLVYTPNTEVSAPGGNFLGMGDNARAGAVNYGQTRVRGLTEADNTRDFFLTDIPWDSYNTGRIDIQRGPNSILFGIGSPAGIVNAGLNHAGFKDSYKVENKLDNFGSVRFSGDFNQVLIDNQLAVRISLLDDHTKYQQKPAFRHDKRFYGALRYDPSFLNRGWMKTSFEANTEYGKIEQNLPRPNPPMDFLTPWFQMSDARQANGFRFAAGVANDNSPEGLFLQGAAGIANQGGTFIAFNQGTNTGLAFPYSQDPGFYRGITDYGTSINYKGKQAQPFGRVLGARLNAWRATTLHDPSIFDFYHILLDGDTKRENLDFHTFNAAFRQEFMDGTFGYELAYDHQKSNPNGHTFLGGSGYGIGIDVMGTLAGDQNGGDDDNVNPNLGKAYVLGGTNSVWNWQHLTKDTARLTAFYNLDFRKIFGAESKIGWILGENRFTGLLSRFKDERFTYFSPSDYRTAEPALTTLGEAGRIFAIDYLSQTKFTGHDPSGINLPGIQDYPELASGTRVYRANASEPYINVPFTPYTEYQLPVESRTYTNASTLVRKTVDTEALVWQGYWFDGTIIPLAAVRHDVAWENHGGVYDTSGDFDEGTPFSTGQGSIGNVYHPFSPDYVLGPDLEKTRITSRTYSLVTHLPKRWRQKLPGNLDFQLIYNQSENFQPAPGRTDIMNRRLPDPLGRTKEYGFAISALNDKLYLKVAHYKTSQKDVNISEFSASDGATVAAVGETEVWIRSAAKIHSGVFGAVGPAITDAANASPYKANAWLSFVADTIYGYSSDGHAVTYKPYGPYALSLGDKIGEGTPTVWDGRSNGYGTWNGSAEPYAQGTVRTAYTQAELDATYAIQKAAIEAVLNNPPPDNFLQALGLNKEQFFSDDPNYFTQSGSLASGAITGSTESSGTEIELVAQPVKGLSVMLNVTKTSAKRTSLAQSFVDWVSTRREFYENGPAGEMRIWNSGTDDSQIDPYSSTGNGSASVAFENHVNSPVAKFLAATNTNVPELHPWAFNLVANYALPDNIAKGFQVGGGYRWQDKLVTGYPVILDDKGFETFDLAHPYKGKAQTSIDLWVSYERRFALSGRHLNWKIQLNVRNVFADEDPIVSSVQPDGTPAFYRIPEPRTFTLTNSFEF